MKQTSLKLLNLKQQHIFSTILLVGWVIPLPVAPWTVGEAGRYRLTSFTHPALVLAVGWAASVLLSVASHPPVGKTSFFYGSLRVAFQEGKSGSCKIS